MMRAQLYFKSQQLHFSRFVLHVECGDKQTALGYGYSTILRYFDS